MAFFGLFGNNPITDTTTAVGNLGLKIREIITGEENAETKIKKLELELENHRLHQAVNQVEASSPSLFVAGWRPFIGWQCGICLGYVIYGNTILSWIADINHWPRPPGIDAALILSKILAPMLGITF